MKWETPKPNQQRVVKRFLIFPVKTKNNIAIWLEFANIKQCYVYGYWENQEILVGNKWVDIV